MVRGRAGREGRMGWGGRRGGVVDEEAERLNGVEGSTLFPSFFSLDVLGVLVLDWLLAPPFLLPLLQVYFPPDSLVAAHFTPSSHTTVCPWKGTASYKNVTVDGATNANAAWVYEAPKAAVANIKGHVAFWKGVQVTRS